MSSADLSTLNMERVISTLVIDRGYNDLSHRRQLAIDNRRSKDEIELDDCLAETLTLCGCHSSVISLWSIPISSQIRFSANFVEALVHKSSIVKSVQMASGSSRDSVNDLSTLPVSPIEEPKRKKTEAPKKMSSSSSAVLNKKESSESISKSESRSLVDESGTALTLNWIRYTHVVYGLGNIVYSPE